MFPISPVGIINSRQLGEVLEQLHGTDSQKYVAILWIARGKDSEHMPGNALKISITTAVLTVAFIGLMWTTMADGMAHYMHVDEVMVEPEAWVGKRLQVHGYASNITWKPSTMDYRFQIEHNGHVVQAEYTGVVPDTFQDEAEVVVSGRLEGHTLIVESDGIMAKCPSKYEAKPTLGASIGSIDDGGSVPGSEAAGVSN